MRNNYLRIISAFLLISLSSCYKTGEFIYLTTCKPIHVSLPTSLFGIHRGPSFVADINYGFPNKRPIAIQRKDLNNNLVDYFTLQYDQANNLIRENIYVNANSSIVIAYTEYIYPLGTSSSITDSLEKRYFILNADGITYRLDWDRKYYFNSEFQLEKVTTNGKPMTDFLYDFGGNLIKETMYTTFYDINAPSGQEYYNYDFSNYDDKVNIFRSDRYLQLFFNVFSKNNPRNSDLRYGDMPDGTPNVQYFFGDYTYNNRGYWITCEPNGYYAIYDCIQ